MNLILYGLTLLLAVWPRRAWPVTVFVAVFFLINVSAYFIAEDGDPRKSWVLLLTPSVLQLLIALLGRGVVKWRREGDASLLIAGYQAVSFATLLILLFADGVKWTWWNWIIIIPVSVFQAEFWPLYWLIWRPLFG